MPSESTTSLIATAGTPPPAKTTTTTPSAEPPVFTPDPAKSEAENTAAKTAFDAKLAEDKAAADKIAADKKAVDDAAVANKVSAENPFKPEEIKLPEGVTLDETTSKGFVELVNKFGLPRDAAAALVELQTNAMKAASEKGDKQWSDVQDAWATQVKADPEVGGTKFAESHAAIGHLLTAYGDVKTRQAFEITGAGNNPEIFKFLVKMAKDLVEPGVRPPSIPPVGNRTHADILFPNQGKVA